MGRIDASDLRRVEAYFRAQTTLAPWKYRRLAGVTRTDTAQQDSESLALSRCGGKGCLFFWT